MNFFLSSLFSSRFFSFETFFCFVFILFFLHYTCCFIIYRIFLLYPLDMSHSHQHQPPKPQLPCNPCCSCPTQTILILCSNHCRTKKRIKKSPPSKTRRQNAFSQQKTCALLPQIALFLSRARFFIRLFYVSQSAAADSSATATATNAPSTSKRC